MILPLSEWKQHAESRMKAKGQDGTTQGNNERIVRLIQAVEASERQREAAEGRVKESDKKISHWQSMSGQYATKISECFDEIKQLKNQLAEAKGRIEKVKEAGIVTHHSRACNKHALKYAAQVIKTIPLCICGKDERNAHLQSAAQEGGEIDPTCPCGTCDGHD